MSIGFPPNVTCKLMTFAEAKFFGKDLRAGKLRNSILGHDRPIHSCCWDETSGSWKGRDGAWKRLRKDMDDGGVEM